MSKDKKLTPLMQQYWEVKNQHPDKVVLFRMGDFFEMFHDDAIIAAPIVNIALTSRNKKSGDETPMCGVPFRSIAGPIGKLLAAGHKVAICDQIEDPAQAKGLVKRAVTRILSPGMVYDPDTLDEASANYLCSFDDNSISFLDTTTGEGFYYELVSAEQALDVIRIISPVELVLTSQALRQISDWHLEIHKSSHAKSSNTWGLSKDTPASMALLIDYAVYMQGEDLLSALQPLTKRVFNTSLQVSSTVFRHLEVFQTYKGDVKGSLFHAINRTKTSAGARLLKSRLNFPLTDKDEIESRLTHVESWFKDAGKLKQFRGILSKMYDIERRLGKLTSPNCHAKDILSLCESLETGLAATEFYGVSQLDKDQLDTVIETIQKIRHTIDLEAPANFKSGGVIVRGFSSTLDEYIDLCENSQKILIDIEQRERTDNDIPSLKIKYNNVFGYFLEVTKTHASKVPDHYKRKQTLANAERYITQELQEIEDKILSAQSKRVELEQEIFVDLKRSVLKSAGSLLRAAKTWAEWDVDSSLAWLAIEYNYCKPNFVDEYRLDIKSCRHPVVEQEVDKPFVANDICLKPHACMLLTGPNMAGKSTLMRQVALVSLLAQIGSFVPAKSATIPVFDKLFTRIGASDFLNEGLSTFMVEMKEAADIIKSVTSKSLVILDEIGRGTSTYDGMSLAQALLEHLVSEKQCLTCFATHYHELTRLEEKHTEIKNFHMMISEQKGEVSFLHTLTEGPANRSYGIQVAKLAGLPLAVTKRATQLLKQHEAFSTPQTGQMTLMDADWAVDEAEIDPEMQELVEQIKQTSIQTMTPIEALNKIASWQQRLS